MPKIVNMSTLIDSKNRLRNIIFNHGLSNKTLKNEKNVPFLLLVLNFVTIINDE